MVNLTGHCAQEKNLAELERRILYGLACEWEHALWVLDPGHRAQMRPPLFRLAVLKERLGSWSAEKREITISHDLVLNHSWDSVREVLLHEMAHQFRDEVLTINDETPHGPAFRQACRLLRANPNASGRYPTLHEKLLHDSPDKQDLLMNKISKLMALAESGNRHEAEAAMLKAHALILKYNADAIVERQHPAHAQPDQMPLQTFTSIFLGQPALRHPLEDYTLSHLLQDFYFVKNIWVPAFVLKKQKMGRVLEASGTPKNIRIASYIYDCIRRTIQNQWMDYTAGKLLTRRQRTDFAVGIITGFRSKLQGALDSAAKQDNGKALIRLKDPLLDRYLEFRYPRLAGFRRGARSVDYKIRQDGERIGKRLIISKSIEQKHEGFRKLLSWK